MEYKNFLLQDLLQVTEPSKVDIRTELNDEPSAHISGERVLKYATTCQKLLKCRVTSITAKDDKLYVVVYPYLEEEKERR